MKQEINSKEYVMGQAATAGAFHYDEPPGEARTMSTLEAYTINIEGQAERVAVLGGKLRYLVQSLNPDALPLRPDPLTPMGAGTQIPPHLDRISDALVRQGYELDELATLIDILRHTVG
jgi:hypothetical protein